MQLTNIELRPNTELKITQIVPFIRTEEDLHFVVDWLLLFGMSSITAILDKHPQMTLADILKLTTQSMDDTIN